MNKNFAQLRKMTRTIRKPPAAAASFLRLGALSGNPCYAADAASFVSDGVSFEVGSGNGAEMWRLGITKNWDRKWLATGNWHLGGYWEAQICQWSGSDTRTLNHLRLSPACRFPHPQPSKTPPYTHGGISPPAITPTTPNDHPHSPPPPHFLDPAP